MLFRNKNPTLSYFSLYKYGTFTEVALVWVSVLLTILASFVLLWIIVEYGEMASMMQLRPLGQTTPPTVILSLFGGGRIIYNGTVSEHTGALQEDLVAHAWAALAQFLVGTTLSTLAASIMNITAVRQANRIRRMFFESALRQDQAFFDTDTSLNVATTMNDNINKIQGGIAEKVTLFVYLMSTGLIGAIFSFFFGWKLALACLTVLPFAVFSAFWVSRYQSQSAEKEQQSYSKAGRLAEATIAGIKTVTAFDGGQTEIDRFTVCLSPAVKSGIKRAFVTGVGMGINWLLTFSLICIGFMYGTRLAYDDQFLSLKERSYYSGSIIIIIYNVFTSVQNIALSSTQTELFSKARGAAKEVFHLISKQPTIDSLRDSGIKPSNFRGEIKLENVHFSYPARPTVKVLKGISLHIKPGETVALVGSSGCGKSTILQLVQRLYDPESGDVFIDKENIKNYNLSWLRGHTGVVGQEPVLFSGTIRENIALGKPDASFEEIENAAKIANAHDFITKLANGYNTYIGERGASLSGGQKQRVAIARSMIRDPPLLLLDEATSALDPASEKRVQVALDKASAGRTTLVISHRLSTIVNASRIICMDQGVIVEEGTHAELLNKKGAYWKLVHTDGDAKQELIEEETGEETTECPSVASPVTPMDTSTLHYPRRRSSSLIKTSEISGVGGFQTFPVKPMTRMSLTNDVEEIDEDSSGEIIEKEKPISIWKILSLSLPEWPWLLVGTLASLIQGATWPVFNVLMEKLLRVFNELQKPNILNEADLYSALYLVVAFCSGVGMFLAGVTYTTAGLKLTKRLRIRTFTSYVNNEIGFFDQPKNSVGVLCARLSEDAAAVQGGVGTCISVVVMSMASFVLCLAVSFVYNWKLSLFAMVFVPMIGGIQWYDTHKVMSTEKKLRRATESATKIATESLIAIKTVQSLGLEKLMLEKFDRALNKASQASINALRFRGLVFALGQFLPMISFNYSLVYGAYLVANEGVSYSSAFFVIQNSFSVGYALGQALMYVPDFRSAAISATRIIKILERKPLIQTEDSVKENPDWVASGEFGLHNLQFSYPTRPHQKVLNGLSLKVEARKKVALVGYSGCGKSTCLQLMQRFYDPATGNIELDGRDIRRALSLPQLRRQLGVVQQEPTLFERTIAENIAYGDNSRAVAIEEIITAAKQANIHAFIASLPKGYETVLGSGGAQLSGGQKQRICIARALLRSPRLLLLDEATSALDSHSQKVVSEALESAAEGRTCVSIAHRLSTIQHADIICVLHKGEIVEKGSHEELMALKGYYRKMHLLQSTETT